MTTRSAGSRLEGAFSTGPSSPVCCVHSVPRAGPGPQPALNPHKPGERGLITQPARDRLAPQRQLLHSSSPHRPLWDEAQLLLQTQSQAVPHHPRVDHSRPHLTGFVLPGEEGEYGRSRGGREARLAIHDDKGGSQFWAPPHRAFPSLGALTWEMVAAIHPKGGSPERRMTGPGGAAAFANFQGALTGLGSRPALAPVTGPPCRALAGGAGLAMWGATATPQGWHTPLPTHFTEGSQRTGKGGNRPPRAYPTPPELLLAMTVGVSGPISSGRGEAGGAAGLRKPETWPASLPSCRG